MTRLRTWLADRCADLGTFFYDLAGTLDPGPIGEPCPDCQVPVVRGRDGSCPECESRQEIRRLEDAIYQSGYDDGMAGGGGW